MSKLNKNSKALDSGSLHSSKSANLLDRLSTIMNKVVHTKEDIIQDKNREGCYKILMIILTLFEEIEMKDKTRFSRKISAINSSKISQNNQSLKMINKAFVYFLLNMTLDDFHKSYVNYYRLFDKNNNLFLNEQEFLAMIDHLVSPDDLGYIKLTKCFEKVAESTYKQQEQIDMLFESVETNQVGPNVIKGMFDVLKVKDPETQVCKPFIDYLKILPMLLGFFSEFIRRQIDKRKDNLEIIRGLDDDGNPIKGTHISLMTKLNGLGKTYSNDKPEQKICFRTLEQALILFRNAYTATLENQQLQIILDELRVKLKIDPKLGKEHTEGKLTFKLLTWISYRICLHSSLNHIVQTSKSINKHAINEEYTFWSAAVYAEKLDNVTLRSHALKHLYKIIKILNIGYNDDGLSYDELDQILKKYLRKFIPHISSESINNICKDLKKKNTNDIHKFYISFIADNLYDALIEEANRKLIEYINKKYEKIDPDRKFVKKLNEQNESQDTKTKEIKLNHSNDQTKFKARNNYCTDESQISESETKETKLPDRHNGEKINTSKQHEKSAQNLAENLEGRIDRTDSHVILHIPPNEIKTHEVKNIEDLDRKIPKSKKIRQKIPIPESQLAENSNNDSKDPNEKKDILSSLFLMENFVEKIIFKKGKEAFISRSRENSNDKDVQDYNLYYKKRARKSENEYDSTNSNIKMQSCENSATIVTKSRGGSKNKRQESSEKNLENVEPKDKIYLTVENNLKLKNHPRASSEAKDAQSISVGKTPKKKKISKMSEQSQMSDCMKSTAQTTRNNSLGKSTNIEPGDTKEIKKESISDNNNNRYTRERCKPTQLGYIINIHKVVDESSKSSREINVSRVTIPSPEKPRIEKEEQASSKADNNKNNNNIEIKEIHQRFKSVNTNPNKKITPFITTESRLFDSPDRNRRRYEYIDIDEDKIQFKRKSRKNNIEDNKCVIW